MNAYNKYIDKDVQREFLTLCKSEKYKVLGNYVNNSTKILMQCPFNHSIEISPKNFRRGNRCVKCSGKCKEQAKEEFLKLCEKERYQVLGNYVNNSTKILVKCPRNHIFETYPRNFKNKKGNGCRKCAKTCWEQAKEEFLKLCEKEGYQVLGEYVKNNTKILMKCTKNHLISMYPFNFKDGHRCANCAKNCNDESKRKFNELMKCDRYTALSSYVNCHENVLVRCNWCDKEFFTKPDGLYNDKKECPRCARNDQETARENFYRKLLINEMEALTDYINNHTKVKVRHEKCKFEWLMIPSTFMYRDGGRCPHCKKIKNLR
ncbi:hypothetical protein BK730_19925 [Bacillus wiedmannii]|uniref:Zinc-ribbon domain-containing protein n=1 Tax=Bacillus wiedmannii TaxID=1890302 RepID=A0A242Z372_9BACI|nr:hypothetical protein [Bacillus wiedmannii]OTX86906.1 hypothetical protein BK730_19925 [Bacillus wiedmannii]